MKAHFITLLFFCFSVHLSLAQKVKIKNEIAIVDDSEYVQIKKVRGANAVSIHEIESGKEVIFVRWMSYSDPSKVSNSNPKGDVRWVELKFLTLDLTCEVDSRARKGLIRFFLDNELFENGELNEEAVQLLVKKYGSNFSANRPESVIIINNWLEELPDKIVFYDGDCGFCNRSVNYVLKKDTTKSIYFASLQSEITKNVFEKNNWAEPDLSTFYFMENGQLFEKSKAAFKVLRYFPWYLKWIQVFRIFPLSFRDWVYDQIAKRRRKISKGYCVMPSPEERKMFLS